MSRARQDEFALLSHQQASRAQDAGLLAEEIVPVGTPDGTVTADEGIRPDLTLAELAGRKPAFRPDWSAKPEEFQRALELGAERDLLPAEIGRENHLA